MKDASESPGLLTIYLLSPIVLDTPYFRKELFKGQKLQADTHVLPSHMSCIPQHRHALNVSTSLPPQVTLQLPNHMSQYMGLENYVLCVWIPP